MFAHYSYQVGMFLLMIFGFGFVVFSHELGHFLAARWVDIRVEQFAVGFGQALCAYRKGIGWKYGSTNPAYREKAIAWLTTHEKGKAPEEYSDEEIARAAAELGLGETEYRLNWIPLGGYVKMVGQDDLKANAEADDPRAYNRKTIGQRMIVVSAGVIMNIILAAIGFMVIFLVGFSAPAPIVGRVIPGSPAQKAGVHVGDRIISLEGSRQYDFNKVSLTTALLKENRDVPMVVQRTAADGSKKDITLQIRPGRMDDDPKGFLAIGIDKTDELRGLPVEDAKYLEKQGPAIPDFDVVQPGDEIVSIGGQPVKDAKYGFPVLDAALQHSDGQPVAITVKSANGSIESRTVQPHLATPFGGKLAIAGMEPRPVVEALVADSSAVKKLKPGDVIEAITVRTDIDRYPDINKVHDTTLKAGNEDQPLTIQIERQGKSIAVADVPSKTKLGEGRHGLGIQIGYDDAPVVSQVLDSSPASKAGIPSGARIMSIDGHAVGNWFQVSRLLGSVGSHVLTVQAPSLSASVPATAPAAYTMQMTAADVESLQQGVQAACSLTLHELEELRKTSNPFEAMSWGVVETRDFILQFYVTIARMFQGSVSYANMMGPVGIVTSGAKFASRGPAWLIWFLAMISANLAVVNFLPIPIVDGGLFTFLIVEKINGRPLSPKVQAVAQVVGFALICGVFLLVTFQDIKRYLGY
jgi:regulator of sigma E protease